MMPSGMEIFFKPGTFYDYKYQVDLFFVVSLLEIVKNVLREDCSSITPLKRILTVSVSGNICTSGCLIYMDTY